MKILEHSELVEIANAISTFPYDCPKERYLKDGMSEQDYDYRTTLLHLGTYRAVEELKKRGYRITK